MRRYGYSFIKGSGADYLFNFLIEALFFGGVVTLPFLMFLTPSLTVNLFAVFFLLLFVFGVIAILAEMLPRTALYISLILITGLYSVAIFETVKYALGHKLDGRFFSSVAIQTLYYSAVAYVNVYLIKGLNRKKNISLES